MVEVRISVDGGERDAVELLEWLRRDAEARKVVIRREPLRQEPPADTTSAAINTVTQLGALVMAIVAFRATRSRGKRPQVSFTAPSGVRVLVQDADAETIKFVWDVINSDVAPQRSLGSRLSEGTDRARFRGRRGREEGQQGLVAAV